MASPANTNFCDEHSSSISTTLENILYLYEKDEDGLCDDDDDDDYGLTKEELDEYWRAVKESEGFDVPALPDSDFVGMITPIDNLKIFEPQLLIAAEEAIKHYNKENGTNFEVVEIVKATNQAVCGIMYYVTFEVKEIGTHPNHPTITFQAKVLDGFPDIEVEFCRPKPKSSN